MGSSEQKKLDLKIQNLIDYPHSGFKSDIMDLFLCQNCKFFRYLIWFSYKLYFRPIALSNYLPTSTIYLRKKDIFIPKILIDKKSKKIIPFSKQFSWPYSLGISEGHYRNLLNVDFVNNSSDEIKNLVREMLYSLKIKNIIKNTNLKKNLKAKFNHVTKNLLISDKNLKLDCRISDYF